MKRTAAFLSAVLLLAPGAFAAVVGVEPVVPVAGVAGAAGAAALAPAAAAPLGVLPSLPAASIPAGPSASAPVPAALPTAARVADLYAAAHPDSQAVRLLGGRARFAETAGRIVSEYSFLQDHFMERVNMTAPREVAKAVAEVVKTADARDPASRAFLEALGRRQADAFLAERGRAQGMRQPALAMLERMARKRPHMPAAGDAEGEYWDMAAGLNAGSHMLDELTPGKDYAFFDHSPFVVAYLNEIAARTGARARAEEADIKALRPPAKPLAVLRSKNAIAYAKGFERQLDGMTGWIAEGGSLILQTDPMPGQRELLVEKHQDTVLRLLEDGWGFQFAFASHPGAVHGLDTVVLTRPAPGAPRRTQEEAHALWGRFTDAVAYANRRDSFW
jgi:hypothetical protein